MQTYQKVALSLGLMLLPSVAFAAPQNFAQLVRMLIALINPVVAILAAVAMLVFFWGIIKYIYSAGGENQAQGRIMMMWGVIALFVLVSIFSLARLASSTILGTTDFGNRYNPFPESGTQQF